MPRTHQLDCDVVHYVWDNAIAPRLEIDPGDTVVVHCRDSSDGYYKRGMTAADIGGRVVKGHPLSGPIAIKGAKPGDVLCIDVLDLVPGDLGDTSFRPGIGLLQEDFPLRSSTRRTGSSARSCRSRCSTSARSNRSWNRPSTRPGPRRRARPGR